MNIFDGLKEYGEKKKSEAISDKPVYPEKNSRGVYTNEYTSQSYSNLCKRAAYLSEDAFDGNLESECNIK